MLRLTYSWRWTRYHGYLKELLHSALSESSRDASFGFRGFPVPCDSFLIYEPWRKSEVSGRKEEYTGKGPHKEQLLGPSQHRRGLEFLTLSIWCQLSYIKRSKGIFFCYHDIKLPQNIHSTRAFVHRDRRTLLLPSDSCPKPISISSAIITVMMMKTSQSHWQGRPRCLEDWNLTDDIHPAIITVMVKSHWQALLRRLKFDRCQSKLGRLNESGLSLEAPSFPNR